MNFIWIEMIPRDPKTYSAYLYEQVLTLPVLCEDTGGDAADVLSADAGVMNLHLDVWQRHDMEVALIGQNDQAALAVVLRTTAAKPSHAHPAHSGAVYGRQLQLHLGAYFWQSENLNADRNRNTKTLKYVATSGSCLFKYLTQSCGII